MLLLRDKDNRSSFNDILSENNSVKIHQGNTQIITSEILLRKIKIISETIIVIWINNNLVQLTV